VHVTFWSLEFVPAIYTRKTPAYIDNYMQYRYSSAGSISALKIPLIVFRISAKQFLHACPTAIILQVREAPVSVLPFGSIL
jgi:hypothetical protein